jgi:hypothetical protein
MKNEKGERKDNYLIFVIKAQTYGAGWVRLWEDEWAWQENATDYSKFVIQAQLAKKYNLKVSEKKIKGRKDKD